MSRWVPIFLFLVLTLGCIEIQGSSKHLDNSEWEELEGLLKQVYQVGDRIIEHDDSNDESTVLFREKPTNQDDPAETEMENKSKNPCENFMCGWGKECISMNNRKTKCECAKKCPDIPQSNENDRVCSNRNHTFESICHLYRERCLCKKNDPSCTDLFENQNLHLEYLGACKELLPCTDAHLEQFSVRMADWLFQVMKDMKKRQDLHGEKWIQMLEEAEHDDHLKQVYPVIWKYCDLDRKPHDKAVTHHELIPIIAPVMPMESCIKPFLRSCDSDKNDLISLKEWGMCLGLREDKKVGRIGEEITERC